MKKYIKGRGTSSKYNGVHYEKRRDLWRATISNNKAPRRKGEHIGYYKSEEEAAREWDKEAFKMWWDYEILNFPKLINIHQILIECITKYINEHDEDIVKDYIKVVNDIFDEIKSQGFTEYEQTQLSVLSCKFNIGEMERFVFDLKHNGFSVDVYNGIIMLKPHSYDKIYTITYSSQDREFSTPDDESSKVFTNNTQMTDVSIYCGDIIAVSDTWSEMGIYSCGNYSFYDEDELKIKKRKSRHCLFKSPNELKDLSLDELF